jgi:hypothetical protein
VRVDELFDRVLGTMLALVLVALAVVALSGAAYVVNLVWREITK